MKTIQILMLLFLSISLGQSAIAQSFFARFSPHSGQLEEVVVWQPGMVFGLSGQGQLEYIILDQEVDQPQEVKSMITTCTYLNKSVTYEGDLRIYHPFSGYLEYHNQGEESHQSGKLAMLGDIPLNYFDFLKESPRNGLLAGIGNCKIDYFDLDHHSYKTGKVSRIGAFTFDYYDNQSEKSHKNGTFSRIGSVQVETYDFDYTSPKNGKLARMGDCEFDYFDFDFDSSQNGKFFEMKGEDERFMLLQLHSLTSGMAFAKWAIPDVSYEFLALTAGAICLAKCRLNTASSPNKFCIFVANTTQDENQLPNHR